ncbi:MAG: exodeoxyribonuclease VII small subunit [Clostridiales bacterium]|jgi:exodeoxyribonuclease VII small subunit|nr:exodeoxyribonuclease VII small subunit [Clostridiales bacterium]
MKIDFDKAVAEIEDITKRMEDPSISLTESIELFNEGVVLSKKCLEVLEDGKGKIMLLTDEVNNVSKPFDVDEN